MAEEPEQGPDQVPGRPPNDAAARRWAAVLGSPIAHSLSPILHRAAYRALGLAGWSYEAVECPVEALPARLQQARDDPAFAGYSLTMPLKLAVLPQLDELEPLAARMGAVNTVTRLGEDDTGLLLGANTDVPGMVQALRKAGVAELAHAVVLGAGGSAQAALAALAELGRPHVAALVRRPERARALRTVAEAVGVPIEVRPWGAVPDTELVIATTPAGATDGLAADAAAGRWPAGAALFDILYAPWPTPLAAAVQARGERVVGGAELLVAQALGQVERMTGRSIAPGVLHAALAGAGRSEP